MRGRSARRLHRDEIAKLSLPGGRLGWRGVVFVAGGVARAVNVAPELLSRPLPPLPSPLPPPPQAIIIDNSPAKISVHPKVGLITRIAIILLMGVSAHGQRTATGGDRAGLIALDSIAVGEGGQSHLKTASSSSHGACERVVLEAYGLAACDFLRGIRSEIAGRRVLVAKVLQFRQFFDTAGWFRTILGKQAPERCLSEAMPDTLQKSRRAMPSL